MYLEKVRGNSGMLSLDDHVLIINGIVLNIVIIFPTCLHTQGVTRNTTAATVYRLDTK